ncbi:MAG: VCBS repeat-containing protein, partial [Magnetospirillum sp.]|nr:VCBS repeat-containing protein [Magnetospirillum sp.]
MTVSSVHIFGSSSTPILLDAASGAPLTVPSGFPLASADYHRIGPNLVIDGANGARVVVTDFFAIAQPPDLFTPAGARIPADLAVRLAGPLAPGQFAQAAASPGPSAIGEVDQVKGAAEIRHADGTTQAAAKGSPVYEGDIVTTGAQGSVGLVLNDGSTFSVGNSARMVLEQLSYDPDSNGGSSTLSVTNGPFSFVSGEIAKTAPDAMTVKTPVLTIGVRGTTVAGIAAPEGGNNTVSLLSDAGGKVGQIAIKSGAGIQVMSQPNQTIQLASYNQPPPPPTTMSPQQIQQMYGSATQSLPPAQPPIQQRGDPQQQQQQQQQQQKAAAETKVADAAKAGTEAKAAEAKAAVQAAGISAAEAATIAAAAAAQAAIQQSAGATEAAQAAANANPFAAQSSAFGSVSAMAAAAAQAANALGQNANAANGAFGTNTGAAQAAAAAMAQTLGGIAATGGTNAADAFAQALAAAMTAVQNSGLIGPTNASLITVNQTTTSPLTGGGTTTTTFDDTLTMTTATTAYTGGSGNTQYVLAQNQFAASYTITDSSSTNRLTFTDLSNSRIEVQGGPSDYYVKLYNQFSGGSTIGTIHAPKTITQIQAADPESSVTLNDIPGLSGMTGINDRAYIVSGTSGADSIDTSGLLSGAGGAPSGVIIFGGAGNDIITPSLGNNIIFGGSGTDVLSYANAAFASGVTININAGSGNTVSGNTSHTYAAVSHNDSFYGIESLIGSSGNDTFVIALGPVPLGLDGGAGTDSLSWTYGPTNTTLNLPNFETINVTGMGTFTSQISGTGAVSVTQNGGGALVLTIDNPTATVTAVGSGNSVTVTNGAHSLATTNVGDIYLTSGGAASHLTMTQVLSGSVNVHGTSDAAEHLTLAAGTNNVVVSGIETVSGGTGADTMTTGTASTTASFQAHADTAVGTTPLSIGLGDLNGDGKLDMVVGNNGDNTVSIMLGQGDGTFVAATPATAATGTGPSFLSVGDLNNDGKLDVVVNTSSANAASILLGNGDGTFGAATTVATGTAPIATADLNGDGKLDMVVADFGRNNAPHTDGHIYVMQGNGDGTFGAATSYSGAGSTHNVSSVSLGDMNGDGRADIVVTDDHDSSVSVLLNNGSGVFGTATATATGSGGTRELFISLADFNGDAKLDVATVNYDTNTISILEGNGDGSLKTAHTMATGTSPYSLAIGDVNGDQRPDVLVANSGAATV